MILIHDFSHFTEIDDLPLHWLIPEHPDGPQRSVGAAALKLQEVRLQKVTGLIPEMKRYSSEGISSSGGRFLWPTAINRAAFMYEYKWI